jgi:type VI protein secretion system component Hcp
MATTTKYFLKLDSFKGSSKERGHEGEIELRSIDWKSIRPTGHQHLSGDGRFHFTRQADWDSKELYDAVREGRTFSSAVVAVEKHEGEVRRVVQRATMRTVTITEFQAGDPLFPGEVVHAFDLIYKEIAFQ